MASTMGDVNSDPPTEVRITTAILEVITTMPPLSCASKWLYTRATVIAPRTAPPHHMTRASRQWILASRHMFTSAVAGTTKAKRAARTAASSVNVILVAVMMSSVETCRWWMGFKGRHKASDEEKGRGECGGYAVG